MHRAASIDFAQQYDPPSSDSMMAPDRLVQACLAQQPPTAPPRARLDALARLRKVAPILSCAPYRFHT